MARQAPSEDPNIPAERVNKFLCNLETFENSRSGSRVYCFCSKVSCEAEADSKCPQLSERHRQLWLSG